MPEGLTALDLDTIRLTAQCVARNGKAFLTGLAAKEHGNPHFNFLKPTHSLFGFFTGLCDAYSKVLMPPKGLGQKLARTSQDRSAGTAAAAAAPDQALPRPASLLLSAASGVAYPWVDLLLKNQDQESDRGGFA